MVHLVFFNNNMSHTERVRRLQLIQLVVAEHRMHDGNLILYLDLENYGEPVTNPATSHCVLHERAFRRNAQAFLNARRGENVKLGHHAIFAGQDRGKTNSGRHCLKPFREQSANVTTPKKKDDAIEEDKEVETEM